nr:hypothetical protein [Frankia sp. Mgl5]
MGWLVGDGIVAARAAAEQDDLKDRVAVGVVDRLEVVEVNERRYTGSQFGGIRETQEMLDFCAEHNVTADIDLIRADRINEAYGRA